MGSLLVISLSQSQKCKPQGAFVCSELKELVLVAKACVLVLLFPAEMLSYLPGSTKPILRAIARWWCTNTATGCSPANTTSVRLMKTSIWPCWPIAARRHQKAPVEAGSFMDGRWLSEQALFFDLGESVITIEIGIDFGFPAECGGLVSCFPA